MGPAIGIADSFVLGSAPFQRACCCDAPTEPSPGPPAPLAGNYAGVTAGAAFGVGANANALIGGANNSFALQPVSFEGQTGVNVAVGVAGLELRPADAWPRPIRRAAHMHRVRHHHHHAAS